MKNFQIAKRKSIITTKSVAVKRNKKVSFYGIVNLVVIVNTTLHCQT